MKRFAVATLVSLGILITMAVASPASAEASCPPTVEEGSTGYWVEQVQIEMNRTPDITGGPITVDGIFGQETKDAVISFQADWNSRTSPDAHVYADGIVGPQTWTLLYRCTA